jgi:proline iminopeptidase
MVAVDSGDMYQKRRSVVSPDKHTLQETFIEVGDGHTLYVHEWGNPEGMPVVFFHGGPGSGSKDRHKQAFDPSKHKVIFFDQRGAGRSIPYGSLENNTTTKLVEDTEKIVKHLKLTSFTIAGGSWGACLALAYGLAHPKRVKAMVLQGIFTGSQAEIDYFNSGAYALGFPDVWKELLDNTPEAHRNSPVTYHYDQVLSGDQQAVKRSAYVLENMERALLSLDDRFTPEPFNDFDPSGSILETHYMANRCFMPDRSIMTQAHKLTMPIWLIQGRYDMVCPGRTAYELNQLLPRSELIWTTSGHSNERESWNIARTLLIQLANERGRTAE